MASAISQNEIVYRAIKNDVVEGRYMPGQRLESRVLSERHASSNTPVRMALSRLVGERLVEIHPNDGFHIPMVTEKSVRDLFVAARISLDSCIELLSSKADDTASRIGQLAGFPFERAISALFTDIALAADNDVLIGDVENHNDRSLLLRRLDGSLDADRGSEVSALQATWQAGDLRELKSQLNGFHRTLIFNIPEVVKLAYLPRKQR